MVGTVQLMPDSIIYIVVIYKSPKDYRGKYVARKFNVYPGGEVPTDEVISGDSIRDVRYQVASRYPNLVRLDRSPEDEKHIYEVWV